jgi:hypothetical protein
MPAHEGGGGVRQAGDGGIGEENGVGERRSPEINRQRRLASILGYRLGGGGRTTGSGRGSGSARHGRATETALR